MPLEVMRRLAGGPRERHITAEELVVELRQGLVLVMPFALLSASSTWTWVGLKNDGFFDGDQVWDQELFTSRGMQFYEILYGFEIYSLVFSLLSIAGDPVSIEDVSLTTLSVTLSLLYRSQLIFRDQNYVSNAINFVCVYTPCLYTQYT